VLIIEGDPLNCERVWAITSVAEERAFGKELCASHRARVRRIGKPCVRKRA